MSKAEPLPRGGYGGVLLAYSPQTGLKYHTDRDAC